MRSIATMLISAALALSGPLAQAQQAPAQKPPVKAPAQAPAAALLPDAFAGWAVDGAMKTVTGAAQADPANAAALNEYSLTGAALATYGAYSYYRHDGWPKEQIGSGATSDHNRVLFWLGNTVVDAAFSHISPMSGSELRELASQIPVPQGTKALPPPILANLPQASLDGQTTHYAVGPAGYTGSGGVLPAELIAFDLGAETATASYKLRSGPAVLTVIDYPTPQMAAAQEAKIRAYIKAGKQAQPAWTKALQDSDQASLEVRRSGPLVALVSGDAIPEESHKLLAMVHFEADLASIPLPTESEVNKTGKLLMGIAALVIIGSSAALLLGFFLGGGRALYRIARGKPASSLYEEEFTSLNLRE